MQLFNNISSLVCIAANNEKCKTGSQMQEICEIKNAAIIFDENIHWLGKNSEVDSYIRSNNLKIEQTYDMTGKTVMPGFVDSHTHIVFAGNRSNEFAMRMRGATYQQIAESGGGIISTMKSTRQATEDELVEKALPLAKNAIKHGTTTMEIKSGYCLDLDGELKMLRAIKKLSELVPIRIMPTFMGAHDFPPEYQNKRNDFVELICKEMLPAVAEQGIAEFCDAFVDKGYYTIEQGEKIFNAAKDLGLKIRCHADELADVSAASMAASLGAMSADHLLFVSAKGIKDLKNSGTVATLLPGTAYFIRMPYAPARKMIDTGAVVALATDCNPGSCFTENMQMVMSLAVINMKMSAEEALVAATLNGAMALGLSGKVGSLEVGKQADFAIANVASYTDIFYHFGINHIEQTWTKGKRIVF